MYVAYAAVALQGILTGGIGKRANTLNKDEIMIGLRSWYLCEVMSAPLSALIRTSVGIFLLRIHIDKHQRMILRGCLGAIWLYSLIYFLVTILQCAPPRFFWERFSGTTGTCVSRRVVPDLTIGYSVIAAMSDWILGLLPLTSMQLNLRSKAIITALLGVGVL